MSKAPSVPGPTPSLPVREGDAPQVHLKGEELTLSG